MGEDTFGNLNDWGIVLNRLEALRKSRSLDEHQPGLTRILRYRLNWKLSETVLDCLRDLQQPDMELMEAVWDIVVDDGVYYEQRILAADCLGHLCRLRPDSRGKVLAGMRCLLNTPQPPFFHKALNQAVQLLEGRESVSSGVRREVKP